MVTSAFITFTIATTAATFITGGFVATTFPSAACVAAAFTATPHLYHCNQTIPNSVATTLAAFSSINGSSASTSTGR